MCWQFGCHIMSCHILSKCMHTVFLKPWENKWFLLNVAKGIARLRQFFISKVAPSACHHMQLNGCLLCALSLCTWCHLDGKTYHQCMTFVNIHHVTFTHGLAVLTSNFCCYSEHYHVGEETSSFNGLSCEVDLLLPPTIYFLMQNEHEQRCCTRL